MSTYRYRAINGVIDIAANSMTVMNFVTNSFIVNSFAAIASQGLHLQWSKLAADGASYILNQKGAFSPGGVKIGSSDQANNVTVGFTVLTEPAASATVQAPQGRLDVIGNSINAGLPSTGASLVSHSGNSSTAYLTCTAGGFATLSFIKDGANAASLTYDAASNVLSVINSLGGGTVVQGQWMGTVTRLSETLTGASSASTTAVALNANATIYRKEVVATMNAGSKIDLVVAFRGRYLITYFCQATTVTNTDLFSVTLNVAGVASKACSLSLTTPASGVVADGVMLVDLFADGVTINLTTTGTGTSAATSVFQLSALRLG